MWNKIKIWLDDLREAPEGWLTCRTAQEVIYWLDKDTIGYEKIEVTHISLDHDLGEIEETGYEVIKYLQEKLVNNEWNKNIPYIDCHSDNPVGRNDINLGIRAIHRLAKQRNITILEE